MSRDWVLTFSAPAGDPARRVGGLSLALRLALDAQGAGARGVVLAPGARVSPGLLQDSRLWLEVLPAAPAGARELVVSSSALVHRGYLRRVAEHDAALDRPPPRRDVLAEPVPFAPPYGFEPRDVTDDRSARDAERALFRSLRKPQDGWTSRWLNRYLSLALSRWLVRTPLTPNQVSVGILAIGLGGAALATRGDWASLALGGALFQAQSVLDGCDGEMSRVTHRGSLTGEWLDTVGDDLTNYGFFGAAGLGLYRQSGQLVWLVAALVTVACGVVGSGLEYRYLIKIGSGDLLKYPLTESAPDAPPSTFDLIRPLFKRDTFVFLTFLAGLTGLVGPMLVIFALGALGVLVSVVRAEARMARAARGDTR